MRFLAAATLFCLAASAAAADPLDDQIEQLRSRYLSDRERAADEIVKFGEKAIARVSELLRDADARVQRSAVEILCRIGSPDSIRPLVPLIDHADPTIREQVRGSFLKLGRAVRPALEAARDADAKAAPDIQELLLEMTQSDIEAAFRAEVMPDGSTGFFAGQFRSLKALGPDIGPMLARMAADGFEFRDDTSSMGRFRIMAIDAIADIGYTEAVQDLLRVADGEGDAARAAAGALWRLGQKEPAEKMEAAIRQGLDQGPIQVRMMAQQNLAELFSRTDQFEKAVEMYQSSLATSGGRQGTLYYNLACTYSRMGKKKEAVAALKRAVDGGFGNGLWMKRDGDLDAIRGEPEYRDIERKLYVAEDPEGQPLPPPPTPEGGSGGQTE